MTENELRQLVKQQIIEGFEKKRSATLLESREGEIKLPELRSLVRKELLKKLKEGKKSVSPEAKKAADQLSSLNGKLASFASEFKDEGKKKSESLAATGVGLMVGLPGLFHMMAKMASFLAKAFNKVGGKFDPEKEGETFHHWSEKTHEFYISSILTPVAKKAFKKQIGGDEKKARIYAEVLYAVLLAAVAVHAGIEVVTHLPSFSNVVQVAYEAAHGAETGLTAARMSAGIRAAFAAINEMNAVEAVKGAMAA